MDAENGLFVRRVAQGDAGLLFCFFESLSAASRSSFRPHPFDRETAERIAGEELNDPDIRRYLAVARGEEATAAGYAFFWNWTTERPSIGIAVGDAYQGRGVGGRLMRFLIEEARRQGKKGLELTTDKANTRGQQLYLKCGFRIAGEGAHDDYVMELDLP